VVEVKPEKDLYKPRDKVKVELKARPRLWASTSPPPMELAVAVLDEAVFDLIGGGDASFDPYRGFYSLEPLDVENFNLLTRLIGIQKFEKKGANPGGDGAAGPTSDALQIRELLEPGSRSRRGRPGDDRVRGPRQPHGLAHPHDGGDRGRPHGTGTGHFVVNRHGDPAALPNQVTEGDRFDARFTVMNRTEEIRT
jgi:uncharacterized protein YfaS (alpha-2-macroglobulin family)